MSANETLTYRDETQETAAAALHQETLTIRSLARTVRDADSKSATAGLDIGRHLNLVADSGMAVAAANTLDGGKRDWTDGRTTEVSAYIKVALSDAKGNPIVNSARASEWRATARNIDGLTAGGVDITKVPTSAIKRIKSDAPLADVVTAVQAMVADADGEKVSVDAFKSAGIDAGIVRPPNNSGTVTTVDPDPFATAISNAVKAIVDAGKLSKAQREQVTGMVETAAKAMATK